MWAVSRILKYHPHWHSAMLRISDLLPSNKLAVAMFDQVGYVMVNA